MALAMEGLKSLDGGGHRWKVTKTHMEIMEERMKQAGAPEGEVMFDVNKEWASFQPKPPPLRFGAPATEVEKPKDEPLGALEKAPVGGVYTWKVTDGHV